MKNDGYSNEPVLVIGNEKLAFSLVVCLLQANHPVSLLTKEPALAREKINVHLNDLYQYKTESTPMLADIEILQELENPIAEKVVIAITNEDLSSKKQVLQKIEKLVSPDTIIAINTESISLDEIQEDCKHKERVIGANWVEPVHTTYFLEMITNKLTAEVVADKFLNLAKQYWQKDPYLLKNGLGIRTRMMCAMIREAFYLIKQGYVTPEDIDRACRNDPGYYFPFAGNFRYMDLMGTFIYGVVMQDLNPDLSKDREIPEFFNELIEKEKLGMKTAEGFFKYEEGEVENWHEIFRAFSYQIQKIIEKYPFQYQEEEINIKK